MNISVVYIFIYIFSVIIICAFANILHVSRSLCPPLALTIMEIIHTFNYKIPRTLGRRRLVKTFYIGINNSNMIAKLEE